MTDPREEVRCRDLLVDLGYLRCEDLGDLRIYNYTDRCFRQRAWSETTLNSRGIIFNRRTGECVARPFPKFFMVDEPGFEEDSLPWDAAYTVTEKIDGWLGILYRPPDGGLAVATRGSFGTEASAWATERLYCGPVEWFPDEVTLLFEIVHPLTRVVVEYPQSDLYVLAAYNRHTGEEYSLPQVETWAQLLDLPMPTCLRNVPRQEIVDRLNAMPASAGEGFVIRFDSGLRVKVKSGAYLDAYYDRLRARRLARMHSWHGYAS